MPDPIRNARPNALLIPDWKRAHRLWSVRLSALGTAMMIAWTSLPDDLRSSLPHAPAIAAALFALTAASRLLAQTNPADGDSNAP